MTRQSASFDAAKAVAAIGYLVRTTGADLYSVMKMLYLADKSHLAGYGRTISGDVYTAMKRGPVPERAYNLCKFVAGKRSSFDPMPNARELLGMEGNSFVLNAEPDLDELSRSDVAALDDAAAVYREGGWRAVFAESHDDAWSAAWQEAQARGSGSLDMHLSAIASTLPNAAELIEFMADPHPGMEDCARSAS